MKEETYNCGLELKDDYISNKGLKKYVISLFPMLGDLEKMSEGNINGHLLIAILSLIIITIYLIGGIL